MMRGLSLLDIVVILLLLALLVLAAREDFARYAGRTLPAPAPTAAPEH